MHANKYKSTEFSRMYAESKPACSYVWKLSRFPTHPDTCFGSDSENTTSFVPKEFQSSLGLNSGVSVGVFLYAMPVPHHVDGVITNGRHAYICM